MSGLNLVGTVSLDGAGWERGISRLGSIAASSLRNFIAGAVGVYGVQQAIQRTVESASELVETSMRFHTTIEQLQVLRQAAKDNNVEFSQLATWLGKLNVARGLALEGGARGQNVMRAFTQMGVSREMLQTQSAADLLMGSISQKIRNVNPESIALPLSELFGRGFGPVIQIARTDFAALSDSMNRYGALMDTKSAVELKKFKDELDMIGQILTSSIAPVLVFFGKALVLALGSAEAFVAFIKHIWHPNKGFAEGVDAFTRALVRVETMDSEAALRMHNAGGTPGKGITPLVKGPLKSDIASTSLTQVGNFLGLSKAAFSGIQESMADDVKRTAVATEKIAAFVGGGGTFGGHGGGGSWGVGGGGAFGGHGGGGSWGDATIFPIN